jgi:aminoglycoside phosphotransferase (APT) family kinase protein
VGRRSRRGVTTLPSRKVETDRKIRAMLDPRDAHADNGEAVARLAALGEPIPGTANLYPWSDGQVLKLYSEDAPADWVAHVGRVDRALHEAGLPVPSVAELVEIEGRLGQVYERIEGDTIAGRLFAEGAARPERLGELARIFAEVHVDVHAHGPIAELPSQQHLLSGAIRRVAGLLGDVKAATLRALDCMPTGDRLCHGDYHPFNVLLSPQGPTAIDWNNAHFGNPLEDVARTALILAGVVVSQPELGAMADQFRRAYLDHYFQIRPGGREQLGAWMPIVAAVRLADDVPELNEWLLEHVRTGVGRPV